MVLAKWYPHIPDQSDMEGQAVYLKRYHGDEISSIEEIVKEFEEMENKYGTNCRGLMDLAIVMDGSGSINLDGNDNYKTSKRVCCQNNRVLLFGFGKCWIRCVQ